VIAKSSRLERQALRVLLLCWVLMPCHLSCYIPTPGWMHPGARTCWEISVEHLWKPF